MPFCTSCGSQVAGRFCMTCGAPAPAAASSAAPAPAVQPAASVAAGPTPPIQAPAPPVAAAPKKTSPIVWILLALGVMFLLVVGLIAAGGFFVVHKARQAGLDPALWERNPGLAAAKLLAAANPDAEIVSMDEKAGIVVIRDKKDGKTIRMNFADLKSGRITFEGNGEKVSIAATGEGDSAGVEVQSKDGTSRLASGAAVKLPSWLPAYAGAREAGGISGSGPDGDSGTYGFKTSDPPATVVRFYEGALKKAGFTTQQQVESEESTILTGESSAHTVRLAAAKGDSQTSVTITFTAKSK
jgi:hypothetical protein